MLYFYCIFYVASNFLKSCVNKNEISDNIAKLESKVLHHIFKMYTVIKNSVFYKCLSFVTAA